MKPSKIAQLPEDLRLQINRRLQFGENAVQIASWLNALPEAQIPFAEAGTALTVEEADIETWRTTCYIDWLTQQSVMSEANRVTSEADELSHAADVGFFANKLAAWLAGRYALATRQLAGQDGAGALDWERLRAFCHDLAVMRRGDRAVERVEIARERLKMDQQMQKDNLERLYLKWAKENPEKLPQKPELTPEEKKKRMRAVFGMI
jgi:hypothetical protein